MKGNVFIPNQIAKYENGKTRYLTEDEWDGLSFRWLFESMRDKTFNDKIGYIYLCENSLGKVKIGRSVNPKIRLKNIETQGNLTITNYYISPLIKQHITLEANLHRIFKEKKEKGEWFDIKFENAKNTIESLINSDQVKAIK